MLGRKYHFNTDNSALRWLHSLEPMGRIARWITDLQEFEFYVPHRPGNSNIDADTLSRLNHSKTFSIASLTQDNNMLEAQRNDPDISRT